MFESLKIGKSNQSQKPPEENQPESRRIDLSNPQPSILEAMSSQTQTESAPQLSISSQETSGSIHIEPVNYFDDLIEGEEAQAEAEVRASVSASMLSKDQFIDSFFGLHKMAANMTGIEAIRLPNNKVDEPLGREVADTLYETILDIPMLHFMLQPGNKWLGRGFVMIAYVQGMRGAILEERRQKAQDKAINFSQAKRAQAKNQKSQQPQVEGELSPEQRAALTGA